MNNRLFSIFVLFSIVSLFHSAPSEDKVNLNSIPSEYKLNYDGLIYSGYLQSTSFAKLHYVFLPSQSNPSSDPLVLWLNGGPGCSSLLGLFYENGPFNFKDWSTELEPNQYSWNVNANMIYIESPSGVGFSTGNQNNHSDDEVSLQNLTALTAFFLKFPEFRKNDFFISGESYAGIYVPTLADRVLTYNQSVTSALKINLKGILVGNGLTHPKFDLSSASLEFQYGHALYSEETKKKVDQHCGKEPPFDVNNIQCQYLIAEIKLLNQNVNVYDIYRDCFPPSNIEATEEMIYTNKKFSTLYNPKNYINQDENRVFDVLKGDPPCSDAVGITKFFNDKQVQDAFHVVNIKYEICNDVINRSYKWNDKFSFYLYPKLIKSGIKLLKYSGDTDMAVPFTGTIRWIDALNLNVESQYRPWSVSGSKEVAGFVIKYEGLTFATIKGTGHMVPQWKRKESFHFFNSFLKGEDF